jgi:hypothetical protein
MKFTQLLFRWVPTFLAFPLGGLLATLAFGPIRDPLAAAVSGANVGALLGLAQWWALKPLRLTFDWVWTTALALMIASPIAWALINFSTTIADLTIWGLITGSIVGFAQAASQRNPLQVNLMWSGLVSIAWGGAWFISANVIVDADENYAIFGSTGAIVATSVMAFFVNLLLAKKEKS